MTSENAIKTLAEVKADLFTESVARTRLGFLFDENSMTELDVFLKSGDDKSGVITAFGYVEGSPVYAFSQDSTVKSGGMTTVQASKIKKVLELSAKTGVPVVGIYDSFGADISDNIAALNAYGELMLSVNNISGVVPQISVIAGTCAGTAAMLASTADFVVMSEKASFFVTPNSDDKDYAQKAVKNGTVSILENTDEEAVKAARKLVSKLPLNNIAVAPIFEFEDSNLTSVNSSNVLQAVADSESVIELYKGYGENTVTALATINGSVVGLITAGQDSSALTLDDTAKISRFVRTCDCFAIPVVTFIDTVGFEVTDECDGNGAVKSMARLSHSYAEATTPKVAVIVGKAYGPAYIAMAGKGSGSDITLATPNSVISVVDPLAAVEFLHHDKLSGADNLDDRRKEVANEYIENNASALIAAQKGVVDNIVEFVEVKQAVGAALDLLSGKRVSKLPKKHSNMPM